MAAGPKSSSKAVTRSTSSGASAGNDRSRAEVVRTAQFDCDAFASPRAAAEFSAEDIFHAIEDAPVLRIGARRFELLGWQGLGERLERVALLTGHLFRHGHGKAHENVAPAASRHIRHPFTA